MCKLIVYIPVKNDLWCIENSIRHAVAWADHVIVADESSTDGSVDVYRRLGKIHPNLRVIYDRPKMDFTTASIRNYMLEQVRRIKGQNIVFELHADEIISAKMLRREIRNDIVDRLPIGSCLELPWLTLWKDPLQYRSDNSVWSNNRCIFAFRDDGKSRFQSAVFHGARSPESYVDRKIRLDYVPVLHYQFMNIGMDRSKQTLYHMFERNHYPGKSIASINKLYAACFDERRLRCQKVEEDDYMPWLALGLTLTRTYEDDTFNWRDAEVLRYFKAFGLARYAKLNIWHVDWERKRQQALRLGIENMPTFEIVDPRSFGTRLAHKFLNRYQIYPFWTIDFLKLVIAKGPHKMKQILSGLGA